MARMITVKYEMTRTRHFQRLVDFLVDVESLASINADDELQALVDQCRDDLRGHTADEDSERDRRTEA